MSLNFLYCFDENYNNQAFASMCSLLDSISEKIQIFILHQDETDDIFVPSYIRKHEMLKNIEVKKFHSEHTVFPNLDNVHVSEATYYRIYFDDFFDINSENMIYLDSDIICMSDPYDLLITFIKQINNQNCVIGAVTHITKNTENHDRFEDLKMNSSKYFNAGVIIININRWRELNLKDKVQKKLESSDLELKNWDQDLLNNVIDGQYVELPDVLNWSMKIDEKIENKGLGFKKYKNPIFLHFFGKQKPWVGRGLYTEGSELYQSEFRKHSNKFYHIEHRWFLTSLKQLLNSFATLKFLKIKYKLKFFKAFFISYFDKNKG
jgi:lipopolysaccharide biosynthesis glycosyltransferase